MRDREIQNVSRGRAERERDTESEAGSRLQSWQQRAQRGAWSHKPWGHDLSWSRCLTNWDTQAPQNIFFNIYFFWEIEIDECGRSRERGRPRIWTRLQALICQHRAQLGTQTHQPWDLDLSQSRKLNRPSYLSAPALNILVHVYPMENSMNVSRVYNMGKIAVAQGIYIFHFIWNAKLFFK